MSEENTAVTVDEEAATEPSQLGTLKARADLMGIKYHPNIGESKLAKKIELKLEGLGDDAHTGDINVDSSKQPVKKKIKSPHDFMTKEEYLATQKNNTRLKAGKLVRVRVTCMNPNKKEWEGEIFSVGSAKLGTFKKYVPFNSDDGWHVPYIIYEMIKERKCTVFHTVRAQNGEKKREGRLVNEFAVEMLEPLTVEEMAELAQRQAMAGAID